MPRVERGWRRAHDDDLRRREQRVERTEQRRVAFGVALERVQRGAYRALRGVEVALLAEQMAERNEHVRRDAVTRRQRLVGERFRLVDQRLVIVCGEEEAAALVLEMREQHVGERAGEVEVAVAPAALEQLEHAGREQRVVVEISRKPRAAILVRGLEPAVLPELRADEVERARRGLRVVGPRQSPRGAREPADHQPVPRGEDLLVASGPDTARARGEQLGARGIEERDRCLRVQADLRTRGGRLDRQMQMPESMLEVRRGRRAVRVREAEHAFREPTLVRRQQRIELRRRPDVELAFLVLRVRVERAVEAAVRRLHAADDPVRGLDSDAAIERHDGGRERLRIERQQRCVVVQHLLEMRDRPFAIDAVTKEPAAELVVEAARAPSDRASA